MNNCGFKFPSLLNVAVSFESACVSVEQHREYSCNTEEYFKESICRCYASNTEDQ